MAIGACRVWETSSTVERHHPLVLGQTNYWSVQAVDSPFAGGPFATENSFTLGAVYTPSNGVPVPGDLNGDGIVSQSEFAAMLANLNGNVSQS